LFPEGLQLSRCLGFCPPQLAFSNHSTGPDGLNPRGSAGRGCSARVGTSCTVRGAANHGLLRTANFGTLVSHGMAGDHAARNSGRQKTLRRLFVAVFNTTMLVAIAIATILHFFGKEIFRLWLRDTVPYSQSAMDMFLVYVLLNVFWTTCSHLQMALNRHVALARLSLLASVSGVALVYVGGINFGLEGSVAGMLLGEAVFVTWYAPLAAWRYLRDALNP